MSSRIIGTGKDARVEETSTKIQRFYKDKVILLTGGTGFLGKILIEKLLRSCPDIRHIYLLVREKNGHAPEERLKNLLDSVVFGRLRSERPGFEDQLSVVGGDLHRPRLGLTRADENQLTQSVDVLLHAAATIRFDERLSVAVKTNVAATSELCSLAKDMARLKALVYVSTAYSNCDVAGPIAEKVRPPPISPDQLISLAELLDESMLDELTSTLIGNKPNTYIFTKSVAEQVIHRHKASLPVAIFRPSIVVSTVSEPLPGWLDNAQGSTGAAVGILAGLLRTVRCVPAAAANLVPVDLTANALIALAYAVGAGAHNWQRTLSDDGPPVVNFVSTSANSITWGEFRSQVLRHICQTPSESLLWYPFITLTQTDWSTAVHRAVLHHLPARLVDLLTAALGRPTRLRKLYHRMDRYSNVVSYFSTRHFDFEERNMAVLWEGLDAADRRLFPFNMAAVSWDDFFPDYIRGCRQYVLKQDPATIARAKRRIRVLYFIHVLTKSSAVLIAARALWLTLRFITSCLDTSGVLL